MVKHNKKRKGITLNRILLHFVICFLSLLDLDLAPEDLKTSLILPELEPKMFDFKKF